MAKKKAVPKPPAARNTRSKKTPQTPPPAEDSGSELTELDSSASEFVQAEPEPESASEATVDESEADNTGRRPRQAKKGPTTRYPTTLTKAPPATAKKGQSRKKKEQASSKEHNSKAQEVDVDADDQHDWSDDYQLHAKPIGSDTASPPPSNPKGLRTSASRLDSGSKTAAQKPRNIFDPPANNGVARKAKLTVDDAIEIVSDVKGEFQSHKATPQPQKHVQLMAHDIEEIPKGMCHFVVSPLVVRGTHPHVHIVQYNYEIASKSRGASTGNNQFAGMLYFRLPV